MRPEFTAKTKALRFRHAEGCCEGCGVKLRPGDVEYDHDKTAAEGGDNSFENCRVLGKRCCHAAKTKTDVQRIRKTERMFRRHVGIRKPSRFPGSRDSRFKKKISGEVVER